MEPSRLISRIGAAFFALWGIVHVAGGALQLGALSAGGAGALTAMIASAQPAAPGDFAVPPAAAAFMGMGAFTILWLGAFVTVVAVTMNWRNSRTGYLINMAVVGATDAGLLFALLIPGHMAWSDGAVGLVLFAIAAAFSTAARLRPRAGEPPKHNREYR